MQNRADRELDALVAEKVMGWRREQYWFDNKPMIGLIGPEGVRYVDEYPQYSTDIAAAWEVVDEMRKFGQNFSLYRKEGENFWACSFGIYCALDSTPALTICRAALRAVKDKGRCPCGA